MNEPKPSLPHAITLRDRAQLQISGVCEVISFDDASVVLRTTRGAMTVEGENLHVSTLDIDRGEVILDGTVNGIYYTGDGSEKSGFFARLFG
ncbi:MAG: sporulation protein YabP [Clostridia bacterium]|nr:sporulation protein YabP [Clostridia bacterium]